MENINSYSKMLNKGVTEIYSKEQHFQKGIENLGMSLWSSILKEFNTFYLQFYDHKRLLSIIYFRECQSLQIPFTSKNKQLSIIVAGSVP